jgi:hypothetical protein
MKLWLDDIREPARYGCIGYVWAKNYDEAISALESGNITFTSLDHDIGACEECVKSLKHIGDMKTPETTFYNKCPHEKTGYDVICWMEENNVWPSEGMRCHSMNPVGRVRIDSVIFKHYGRNF